MELVKRLSRFAHSAGSLLSVPHVDATNNFLTVPLRKLGLKAAFKPSATALKVYQAVIADKVAVIERLPAKYRKDAKDVIWNSVTKGFDVAGLARQLHDRFGIVPERAQLVASAQCKMARSVMENALRIEQGLSEAVWHYDGERCTIVSHRGFDGKRYSLARGANLEGKRVWPSGEPQCFCSSTIDATEQPDDAS